MCSAILLLCLGSSHADVLHTTLDNGLTVLIDEQHAHPIVAVQVFVRTGSLHEQEYLGSGLSHFFEHIIHGGSTSTRSEAASREMLDAMGNNSNAYTTVDHTNYYINTTTEHWRTAVELLSDWMLHSLIAPEEFAREKGVVQRELEQDLDNAERLLAQLVVETRYQVHPARYPVIGYKELVQRVTREDLLRYYERMYTPNNMLVVVVGDVRTAEVLEHVRATFGQAPRRPLPAISLPEEPPQLGPRTVVKEMPISQALLSLSFRSVPLTHPHLYALDVLADILTSGNSARLVRRLQDEQQLVYGLQASSHTPAYAPGSFSVTAALDPAHLPAATAGILHELYRLREELVEPQELARAKQQKRAEHVFTQQTVEQRARTLGLDMLSAYDPHFSARYVRRIQDVSAEDIREVARLYFREETLAHVVVRPPIPPATVANAVPEATPEAAVKTVLPNGLTLLLQRRPGLPTVAIQGYVRGGVQGETPETNGLSQLMAGLLLKGTSSRSATELATLFESRGASIGAETGYHSFFVTLSCLREDVDALLPVYADLLLRPSFPDEELQRLRRLLLATIERRSDDWRQEAEHLWRELFFTVSPYRLSLHGSATALPHLQRQDVLALYQRYAVAGNVVLAIVGDIDLAQTQAQVARLFAAMPTGPTTPLHLPTEPLPTQPRRQVLQTQKQVAAIFLGFPGATMTNLADRYPLTILDGLLSGFEIPSGWLHHTLRDQQLVYVVHAGHWAGIGAGTFSIYAATQPEQAQTVVDLMQAAIARAQAGEFDDAELQRTIQMALVTLRLQRQTPEALASDLALNELLGLGYDFSTREVALLTQVTKAEVQRVARQYLQAPTFVITTPMP